MLCECSGKLELSHVMYFYLFLSKLFFVFIFYILIGLIKDTYTVIKAAP